jgi:carbamoylphosphate synthase large subunit
LIEIWGIDVFWPASDDEVQMVSAHRLKFENLNCHVLIGSKEVISKLNDKGEVYDTLNKAGIYVPPYAVGKNEVDVWKAMCEFGYPNRTVVVKPTNGRGNRGLNIFLGHDSPSKWLGTGMRERKHQPNTVSSAEHLEGILEKRTMIMPALREPAYDVDVLGGDANEAQVIVRKRNNPSGIPFNGNVIVTDFRIQEYCRSIAEALKLDSLFDMDLLTGPNGVCLLEINSRPSGSLAVSLFAGFKMLDAAVANLYGKQIIVGIPKSNIEVFLSIESDNLLKLKI